MPECPSWLSLGEKSFRTVPAMVATRFGICEWYGKSFLELSLNDRQSLADAALSDRDEHRQIPCPFQKGRPPCRKSGGVCTIQRYRQDADGQIGAKEGNPVVVCPARFSQDELPIRWLAEIVGFRPKETLLAREVAFMRGTRTDKPAGKIDLVVARTSSRDIDWYGLEIQAVYFSGRGMRSDFESIRSSTNARPPFPDAIRRPDWRSSSAKRLMPQLQIKVPTLRRWGSKMAVVVDRQFFESIGGPSPDPSHDLGDGDIVWMVVDLSRDDAGNLQLKRAHWEVLTLEESSDKLLAAETVRRDEFLDSLTGKLRPVWAHK